jgi:hypothetical protein
MKKIHRNVSSSLGSSANACVAMQGNEGRHEENRGKESAVADALVDWVLLLYTCMFRYSSTRDFLDPRFDNVLSPCLSSFVQYRVLIP